MVRRKKRQLFIFALCLACVFFAIFSLMDWTYWLSVLGGAPRDPSMILTTGYCNCGACCGWERTREGVGEAVYTYGPLKGKRKKIGVTASGTRAKHGTIAADLRVFAMGTKLFVPGYGEGCVEDVGGAIKGRHIDLWFPTHDEARRWGRRWLKVIRVKEPKQNSRK